jgi:hypothetical protein
MSLSCFVYVLVSMKNTKGCEEVKKKRVMSFTSLDHCHFLLDVSRTAVEDVCHPVHSRQRGCGLVVADTNSFTGDGVRFELSLVLVKTLVLNRMYCSGSTRHLRLATVSSVMASYSDSGVRHCELPR